MQKAVMVIDSTGRIAYGNQAAADLMRMPRSELTRLTVRDLYHPDELAQGQTRMRELQAGEEIMFVRWLRCCDKRYTRVRVKAHAMGGGKYRAEFEALSEPMALPGRLSGAA
jgi:PAS domain S-box-containing protein